MSCYGKTKREGRVRQEKERMITSRIVQTATSLPIYVLRLGEPRPEGRILGSLLGVCLISEHAWMYEGVIRFDFQDDLIICLVHLYAF